MAASKVIVFVWIITSLVVLPVLVFQIQCGYRHFVGGRGLARALRAFVEARLGRSGGGAEPAADSSGLEVREMNAKLRNERRVSFARYVVFLTWVVGCSFVLLWTGILLAIGESARQADMAAQSERWLPGIFACLMPLTAGVVFPSRTITQRSLRVWLVMATLVPCVAILLSPSYGSSPQTMYTSWPSFVVYSVWIGGLCLELPALLLSSACIATSYIYAFVMVGANFPDQISIPAVAMMELQCYLWRAAIFYWAVTSMKVGVEHEVNSMLGNCRGSAVRALLDLVCDAVVDLDQSFVLKEHSTKLAALMMRDARRPLLGSRLSDFVAREDQQRFRDIFEVPADIETINSEKQEVGEPGMSTMKLCDGMGNSFITVMYHMPYLSIQGRVHHLIGILEAPDEPRHMPAAGLRPNIAETVSSRLGLSSGHNSSVLNSDSEEPDSSNDDASSSAGGGGGSAGRSVKRTKGEGTLTVFAEEGLPIVASDASVSRLLSLEGNVDVCFGDMFTGPGADIAIQQILESAGRVRRGEVNPHVLEFGPWTFTPPGKKPREHTVIVDLAPPMPQDAGRHVIYIRFKELQKQEWRSRRGPLRKSRKTSASSEHSCNVVQL